MGIDQQSSADLDRIRREDCKRTKHDSVFSKWQVLIGSSDWEDFSQGKEGAARYRVYNLPSRSCPGLYELGIAVSSRSGGAGGRLDSHDILVVYLGQADNVRNRLQRYGRSGAHLGNDSSITGHWNDSGVNSDSRQKGLRLFEEIFARGHSLVFRWAPMKDKRDAEKTEMDLLYTFDYAWNKGANGARRPVDILHKLDKVNSRTTLLSTISRKLVTFKSVRVGIKIEAGMPIPAEDCIDLAHDKRRSFLSGIFKLSRSQPRLVSKECTSEVIPTIQVCGYIMSGGVICRRPPVKGRKRCEQHKGMRINGSTSNSIAEENSCNAKEEHLDSQNCQSQTNACGVNLGDGIFCARQPVPGRKRCKDHKGMRITRWPSKPIAEGKVDAYDDSVKSIVSLKMNNDDAFHDHSSNKSSEHERSSGTCGAALKNGSLCRRKPSQGDTRCWQHKCKTVESSTLSGKDTPALVTLTCGVMMDDGSLCKSTPVRGRKRCEQHKGMRVPMYYQR
ncbi:hypothetical protein Tsubulata_046981 [Turnera subulata]|uniref:GIY-YIG domain-containing protein n=1 Tax=Turnera subulata TaxID=218843 RepID=A0A9Q0FI30_9ROSI|nr:hypothetical protein Tsubulata_046981 [Turnera subulata]